MSSLCSDEIFGGDVEMLLNLMIDMERLFDQETLL